MIIYGKPAQDAMLVMTNFLENQWVHDPRFRVENRDLY